MELKRKPFQGVLNIIRFNWHLYTVAVGILIALLLLRNLVPPTLQVILVVGVILASLTILVSLIVSFYVYDVSDLYQLNWLDCTDSSKVLNINAGFDETTEIIQSKFNNINLTSCDFYHPDRHTELSIRRARKIYPPKPGSISVQTDFLPFENSTFDKSLAILSAHEIRDEKERVDFFKELNRITKSSGQVIVTEHLRDFNNFLAYTFGVLHFHSKSNWLQTFRQANLSVRKEIKTTPFITTFILEKNGASH